MKLLELVPDVDLLLSLQPEELAYPVLVYLRDFELNGGPPENGFLLVNAASHLSYPPHDPPYPTDKAASALKAFAEAVNWLLQAGLVARLPEPVQETHFITRRGMAIDGEVDFSDLKKSFALSKEALHPKIANEAWTNFMKGAYETAVFQAFREVEVSVRDAAGLPESDIGVPLTRKAFKPDTGPLTDNAAVPAEQEALSALFAGAIGTFKNPSSHRFVNFRDTTEVVEMLMHASHLLRIVDARAP